MGERKSLSKKIRFEVFKRDSFTCQYCGRMAPDVVLEVDHINSVYNGGSNDIMNLITSCLDCNRGKGKEKISDNSQIKIQQEQLKILGEKRGQLKLMLEWKKELLNFENEQVLELESIFNEKTNKCFTENGKNNFKKWIKKFGFIEIIECLNISINQYLKKEDIDTYEKVIEYVPRIAATRLKVKEDPFIAKRNYLLAMVRKNFWYINYEEFNDMLKYLVNEENYDSFKRVIINSKSWSDFKENIFNEFDWGVI